MADRPPLRPDGPRVVELEVADEPDAWVAAGFAVQEDAVRLGTVALRLTGTGSGDRGIRGWTLAGLDRAVDEIDGLPTDVVTAAHGPPGHGTEPHPNGVLGLDHLVVATPDLQRTIDALAGVGLELRRIREATANGSPMRQAFFRLGPTILEVVSGDLGSGGAAAAAPASFWGLAVDVEDLDATAAHLGDGLGAIRPAVQRGRRIATIRHRHLGLSVAVAAMDHHADR